MIKKTCIKLGSLVAILLMFAPLVILVKYNYDLTNYDCLFFFICSILYDVYYYTVIKFENNKNSIKEHYYKFVKNEDKKLKLKLSYEEKYKVLEEYVEDLLEKYF